MTRHPTFAPPLLGSETPPPSRRSLHPRRPRRGIRAFVLAVGSAASLLPQPARAETESGTAPTIEFVAVTWNVGTSAVVLDHDADPDDGYTSAEAAISDEHYGNGLAWMPAISAAAAFVIERQPEIIAVQEIFDATECPAIPTSAWPGFVCDGWLPGDPSVVEQILGPAYQIACNPGRSDKCVGVRSDFGSFEGCTESLCVDGLEGAAVSGCGAGARVGRGRIRLTHGGELTIVHVHGTSGIRSSDMTCRERQFEQIFQDLDGMPAADGVLNWILGDFNTDPVRLFEFDSSARRLTDFVGEGEAFAFVSDSGSADPPSYMDFVTLDHVISDSIPGDCEVPGLTAGVPAVFETVYFDHKPVVCVPEPAVAAGIMAGIALGGLAAFSRTRHSQLDDRNRRFDADQKR